MDENCGKIRPGGGPNWLGGLLTFWAVIAGPALWLTGVISWKTWLIVTVLWFIGMAFLGV